MTRQVTCDDPEIRMNPDTNPTQAMVIFTSFRGQKLGFGLKPPGSVFFSWEKCIRLKVCPRIRMDLRSIFPRFFSWFFGMFGWFWGWWLLALVGGFFWNVSTARVWYSDTSTTLSQAFGGAISVCYHATFVCSMFLWCSEREEYGEMSSVKGSWLPLQWEWGSKNTMPLWLSLLSLSMMGFSGNYSEPTSRSTKKQSSNKLTVWNNNKTKNNSPKQMVLRFQT